MSLRMVPALSAIIFLSVFSSITFASGIDIGNGGDGIYIQGRLVLRDFAEQADFKPKIWSKISIPRMVRETNELVFPGKLNLDRTALALKLTDIENLLPGAGMLLIRVLKSYEFLVIGRNLSSVPDKSWDDTKYPRKQVAVRLGDQISIGLEAWLELSTENQIGLLIHEAFYSLIPPFCQESLDGVCSPRASDARKLTRLSFAANNGEEFLNEFVSVQNLLPVLREECQVPALSIQFLRFGNDQETIYKQAASFDVEPMPKEKWVEFIRRGCSERQIETEAQFSISGIVRSYELKENHYLDTFGFQRSFQLTSKNRFFTQSFSASSTINCITNFNDVLLSTLIDATMELTITRENLCRTVKTDNLRWIDVARQN